MSDTLRETTVPTSVKSKCTAGHGQICAAEARYGGPDSCEADSGGPLVIFDRDKCPYVVGLVSYGPNDCGRKGGLGVYTRVSAFGDWIRGHVPNLATTPAPVDKAALERTFASVWASVAEIEKRRSALPASQRIALELCKWEGPGCIPHENGPLRDGEAFRVGVPVSSGRVVVAAVSARGDVRQLHPVDEEGEAATLVAAEATARWQYDEGRVLAIALPADGAGLARIAAARDAAGKVADPVAYLKELEAVARQASGVGVMELAVRQ